MNPPVDVYFAKAKKWQAEMKKLRAILLSSELTEELKWGKPCYTYQKSNLVIIYSLKENCALGFLKGALLKDANGILAAPGENSQSARWIKFSSVQEIAAKESLLKAYIREAIAAEKAGLKVDFSQKKELVFPEEFQKRLKTNAALKKAFAALTPGRQRGYYLFFTGAKQSATREARIEKCLPLILEGRGLHDR